MMVRVALLGGLRVWVDGVEAPPITRSRVAALLGYLAAHARSRCARESVATALWPDACPEAARQNLRQTLNRLRAALGGAPFVHANRDTLWLDPRVRIDVDEIESPSRADIVTSVFPGKVLPEVLDDWAHDVREAWEARWTVAARSPEPPAGDLTVPSRRRENLPRFLTTFVGRSAEQDELVSWLSDSAGSGPVPVLADDRVGRWVTLIGPGGVGKTRLAVAVARRLDLPAYFVDLSSLSITADPDAPDLDAMLWRCIRTAIEPSGVGATALATGSSETTALRQLARVSSVLVLDNAETVRAPAARVATALLSAAPGLRLLVTSRERLGAPGERIAPLEGLRVPEAVALFRQRALDSGAMIDEPDAVIAALCERLDHLPLAIEFAAARTRYFPVAEIARRLQDPGLLTALPDDIRPKRHLSIAAVLDGSIALLGGDERAALSRASVFVGGWTLTAAADVCETSTEALLALVDHSLAVRDRHPLHAEARFRLLQVVRQDAAARLEARGEADAARARHARYFRERAETLADFLRGPGQDRALRELRDEHPNLRAAWRALDTEGQLRLAIALNRFWQMEGVAGEWEPRVVDAVGRAPETIAPSVRAAAWCVAGDLGYLSRRADAGAAPFARARALLESAEPTGEIQAIRTDATIGLALAARTAGRFDDARAHCDDAIARARSLTAGNEWRLGRAWSERGLLHRDQQEAALAADALRQALTHFEVVGDRIYALLVRTELAELARHRSDADEACRLYQFLLSEAIELGASYLELRCRLALAEDALRRGALDDARTQLPEAADALAVFGDDWQRLTLADLFVRYGIATGDDRAARHWASVRLRQAQAMALPPPVWIYVLGSVASVAAAFGPAATGARLYGWMLAERERRGMGALTPPERKVYDDDRARLSRALGAALADTLADGAKLNREQVVGIAHESLAPTGS